MSTQQIKFALDALNTSVSTQVRNIKNDVLHFDKYKVNYDAILELPMVKELLIENKKLRSKNRKLEKRLLSVLLDKHNAVKQSEPISSTDDELVIIEHVKDNIVYEIVEDGMELEECSTAFTNVKIKEEVVEEEEEEEEVVEEVVEEEEEVVEEEVVEEEEEEQEEEENKKDEMYSIKLNNKKYPLKFIFSEDKGCSTVADVEWIITHYRPKHTPNIIIKTFIDTFKHIIQHLDELSVEDTNGRFIYNMNKEEEIEIETPLKRIFFHKPDTNMYYMNTNPNLKGINDISTTVQMTFASKMEDTFDVMKQIMRESESDNPMFDKIEMCVKELVETYLNKEAKIKQESEQKIKQIKCLISCILYKIYVYCNIYLQKENPKYLKNYMALNVRHSNYILYKEIKNKLMELFPNESNKEIPNRVKTIVVQQITLNKYLLDNDKNVRRNAFLITNVLDKTNSHYGDPSYSLASYFDFFEEPSEINNDNDGEFIDYDWFEYINLDTLSTKMEIKDDILLIESRNFPNLIADYIYELTQDEYLNKYKRLKIETMRKFIALEQSKLSKSIPTKMKIMKTMNKTKSKVNKTRNTL